MSNDTETYGNTFGEQQKTEKTTQAEDRKIAGHSKDQQRRKSEKIKEEEIGSNSERYRTRKE